MGRPTTEKKDKVVKLRISEEMYEDLAVRGKNLSETIRELLKTGINGIVPQYGSKNDDILREIGSMASFFGTDTDGLLNGIYEGLNDGTLTFRDGKVVGDTGLDLDRFYDICHDLNVDPQEAIDKLVKEMTR